MQNTSARIHIQHIAPHILHKNCVGRILKQVAETPLTLPQFLLRPDPL